MPCNLNSEIVLKLEIENDAKKFNISWEHVIWTLNSEKALKSEIGNDAKNLNILHNFLILI